MHVKNGRCGVICLVKISKHIYTETKKRSFCKRSGNNSRKERFFQLLAMIRSNSQRKAMEPQRLGSASPSNAAVSPPKQPEISGPTTGSLVPGEEPLKFEQQIVWPKSSSGPSDPGNDVIFGLHFKIYNLAIFYNNFR